MQVELSADDVDVLVAVADAVEQQDLHEPQIVQTHHAFSPRGSRRQSARCARVPERNYCCLGCPVGDDSFSFLSFFSFSLCSEGGGG